jgi:hypothetical protein
MSDVRYYLININGRIQLDATSDEEALSAAASLRTRYTTPQKRVVKETRETIWEAENG